MLVKHSILAISQFIVIQALSLIVKTIHLTMVKLDAFQSLDMF